MGTPPGTSNTETVHAEIVGLTNPDHDIRQQSAIALGKREDPSRAELLTRQLFAEHDSFVRDTLTWAVVRVAGAALPHILHELQTTTDDACRTQALHVLSKIADPGTVQAVIPHVTDPNTVVAEKARWALARIGDPAGAPPVMALLGHGTPTEQHSLTLVLKEFGPAAVPALIAKLTDTDPAVRQHAADGLCYIGSPDADAAVPALVAATHDAEPTVVAAALIALAEFDTPPAQNAIKEAAESDNRGTRQLAGKLQEQASRRNMF